MSPLRRIIDKITGQESVDAADAVLRAFGKLPVSREYLHLSAGEGPAKAFQDWVKSGHDYWVRHVNHGSRGRISPSCMFVALPEARNHVVMACVWGSQDSAAPPRIFPFTFFVVQRTRAKDNWLGQFLICEHSWNQLRELFDPAFHSRVALTDLQDRRLTEIVDLADATDQLEQQLRSTPFRPWFDSILQQVGCTNAAAYLRFLRELLDGWREHSSGVGFGVRLPISEACHRRVQIAAWIKWLQTNASGFHHRLTGLFAPEHNAPQDRAVAITFRPLLAGDFQLLTTDARDYGGIEDTTVFVDSSTTEHRDEGRYEAILSDQTTLWDWAGTPA